MMRVVDIARVLLVMEVGSVALVGLLRGGCDGSAGGRRKRRLVQVQIGLVRIVSAASGQPCGHRPHAAALGR